ncbi:MAG: Two-component system response regulator [Acidimicrobiaceae bacterium]|nr:Two-component system response regulator [Acidimicrobiaceae bacterium]
MTPASLGNGANAPATTPKRLLVALAVGAAIRCQALAARLSEEEGIEALELPGNPGDLLRRAINASPQVLVTDARGQGRRDDALLEVIQRLPVSVAGLVLVGERDLEFSARCLEAGALGIVLKSAPSSELVVAIRWAAAGSTWISPPLLGDVLALVRAAPKGAVDARLEQLTHREQEILQLVVDGLNRRQIATGLVVSVETVRTHMGALMNKLGVHSAIAAAAVGRQAGLQPTPARQRPVA